MKGFCPSFVTVDGGKLRRRAPADLGDIGDLPEPASRPSLDRPYNVAVGGVGGTGVLTIGALLGMAAHIEGKASMILDMSGLAQKGGAVLSHVRLSEHTADVTCSRIVTGTADLVIAADEVVAAAKETMTLCESEPHRRRHQQPRHSDRRFHPQPRFQFPDPQGQSRAGNRAAQGFLVPRFHQAGRNPARRFHRHQHDDDGLCLSEGIAAAVGSRDRAGDRGQRRRDQDEHAGVPARASGGRRSGAACCDDEGPGRDGCAEDARCDVARRDHRPSQRASDGLSERKARRRATASW